MTDKLRAAMQQALEALDAMLTHMGMDEDEWTKPTFDQARVAITALREALSNTRSSIRSTSEYSEQAEQEPVAYTFKEDVILAKHWTADHPPSGWTPLYAAPVRTKDLTDSFINELHKDAQDPISFARAVIAADKEKNK